MVSTTIQQNDLPRAPRSRSMCIYTVANSPCLTTWHVIAYNSPETPLVTTPKPEYVVNLLRGELNVR